MLNNKTGTIELRPGATETITRAKSGHLIVVIKFYYGRFNAID